uniref:Uncharacterized protein n=1 Tax=Oryza punctata TaxID=4537 RepID=A0A0E0LAR3_ORYPU
MKKTLSADDDQCGRRGCRCTDSDENDESGEAAGRHSCSSMSMQQRESTGDEAMLRRASLSITTTNGGRPRAATLQPEGQRSGNPKLDDVDACSMTIGCRSCCSRTLERVIKPKVRKDRR